MQSATKKKSVFKSVILSLVLVLGVMFGFCACGTNTGFDDGPTSADVVIGNGTSAVVYGDYVYYVNGYKTYSSTADANVYGNVKYSAIYRTKLTDGKVVEKEKAKDENGEEIFDKTQTIQNTGILVPKVCGFEKTQLYIFGNYLYYTTPGNQVATNGTVENDRVDFCRIKIDGHSRGEKLFTSASDLNSVSFYMYENTINNSKNAYLVVKDGSTLKIAECTKNNFNLKVVEGYTVSSIAPTRYTQSNETVNSIDNAVYFTYTSDDFVSGTNALAKYDLTSKTVKNVSDLNNSQYTLIASVGGKLYYNKKQTGWAGAYLHFNTLSGKSFSDTETNLSKNEYTAENIYPFNAESEGAYVNNGSSIYKFTTEGQTLTVASNAKIIAQKGNSLFYTEDNKLYKKNLLTPSVEAELLLELSSEDATKITLSVVNENLVFYLKEYKNSTTTSYYMHMLNTSIETDDGYYDHFIGVLMEADYLDEPEE